MTPLDILSDLQAIQPEKDSTPPLTIENVDGLEPRSFEVFVAALFEKQGYRVGLTPYSGDKGADVIAYPRQGETAGLVIQVKQRKEAGKPGSEAVDEIVAAKPFYEEKYDTTFQPMIITNREFTKEVRQVSRKNQVQMHERKWLRQNLKKYPVMWKDISEFRFPTG